jgi:hypothetical protein
MKKKNINSCLANGQLGFLLQQNSTTLHSHVHNNTFSVVASDKIRSFHALPPSQNVFAPCHHSSIGDKQPPDEGTKLTSFEIPNFLPKFYDKIQPPSRAIPL